GTVRRSAAVDEIQSCAERFTGNRTPPAEQCRSGDSAPEAAGIPAEDGIGLAAVQAPRQPARQREPCPPGRDGVGPAQDRAGSVEFGADVGAEVEGEAHFVTGAVDLVNDVEGTRRAVQPDRAAVPGGWL